MPRCCRGVQPARKRRFRLSTPNQGLLAITFFEAISFAILLILYFLLDRGRPARFFGFWIAGWAAHTLWASLLMFSLNAPGNAGRLIALECNLSGIALFLASVWAYTCRKVQPLILWPLIRLGWVVFGILEHRAPAASLEVDWFTALFRCSMLVASGWLLWRFSRLRPGYGARLLAATMLLAGLHGADAMLWREQPFFLLRVAFQH